ncbi:hypothetical protein I5I64_00105 [Pseudomonas aeruginosa]|nr:hypothetical protein [Pseudomonas aeruginosa]
MTDSFAADLMVGELSVQEASPRKASLEFLLPVGATGSRRVIDVQKFID